MLSEIRQNSVIEANFSLLDTIRLIRTENVGVVTFYQLIKLYGSPSAAIEKLYSLSENGGIKRKIKICSIADAEEELEKTQKYGAKFITCFDKNYPKLLMNIHDAPPVITTLGDQDILNRKSISIVGSRNATANGCRLAYKLSRELGQNGIATVSGLARGIDSAVHKGSIKSGTIGVIAGGIDTKYPPENESLYDEIIEKGLIISEFPFNSAPRNQNFPRRNRIISGLSLGTLLVEATLKSGSLITARCALEQNREVLAIPGFPLEPRYQGTNSLIKQGATLVESVDDILAIISNREINSHYLGESNESSFEYDDVEISDADFAYARKILFDKLSYNPISIDEIIEITGLAYRIVVTLLLELELAGKLLRYPGNKISLIFEDI